jgi:SpoIIAA-like
VIEPLEDLPAGVIGFRATGHVTRDEYRDVLLPAMREQAEAGEVRLVFAIGPGFEEFEAGAMWEDTKVGVTLGIGHHSAWKRCALATDEEWVAKAFHMFAWMAPGEVETFRLDELDEAKEWAAG